MSTHLDAAPPDATRPLYWSIRREIWENRSLYIAPLIVFAIVLIGSALHLATLPARVRSLTPDSVKLVRTFSAAPAPIMLATFIVGFFYSIDALYSERRDRSILFWKSLPVSDRTTVLAKILIPLVALPAFAWVLSLAIVAILLVLGTLVLIASGLSPAPLWGEAGVAAEPLVMAYGLTVHALWFAPINGYLLLVSAWARRSPLLWAILPLVMIGALERILTGTTYWAEFTRARMMGAMAVAFTPMGTHKGLMQLSDLTPLRFLTTPALWMGLIFAAICVAAAIRLRRNREPI